MKKILIIVLMLFIGQTGFSNSIPNYANDTNNKLIEKLAQNEDVGNLQKLAFGIGILKLKANEELEETGKISKKVEETYERLTTKSSKLYSKILNENQELKKFTTDERSDILEQVAQKNNLHIREILECVFNLQEIITCVSEYTILGRVTFTTCMLISGVADIEALYLSGGTSTAAMQAALPAEVALCDAIAGGIGIISCFLQVAFDIVECVESISG